MVEGVEKRKMAPSSLHICSSTTDFLEGGDSIALSFSVINLYKGER